MFAFFLFRLIDPQTQVTRLRVRWSLLLCSVLVSDSFIVIYRLLRPPVLLLSPPVVPPLHRASVFVSSGQQEAVWFRSAASRRAGWQPTRLLHLWVQQRRREGSPVFLSVSLAASLCVQSVWHVLSPSCVSDLWQHRSGQADCLPLWDGETDLKRHRTESDANTDRWWCLQVCEEVDNLCCFCCVGP